ncbi:MAG: hypothetical protein L0387_06235 [Acidobacteria bacterium]|nr:hypothetical protein [Acidobacteriota bacterium]MCI0721514.1 hypothetical protein [Acidobacteriota bacterium]
MKMHSTEDALDGDDDVPTKGLDSFQERLGTGAQVALQQRLRLLVEDTQTRDGSSGSCG